MSRLALYLLGPPRVYRDGTAVGFDRRKVLALLAYLAVSSHRHSRDETSELLFSGEDRERARANLRQTLSLLGRTIGEDRLSAGRPDGCAVRGPLPHRRGASRAGPLFLFARLPDEWGPATADIETRLRDAIGKARGRILTTARQTICAAFTTARSAVHAAALARDCAPAAGCPPRLVLLSEELPRRAEDPSPEIAHRADLLLEVSHPGQILLSEAAAGLVGMEGLPEGAALRSLGSYRLRDLGPARPLHQLDHQGIARGFPSLDTLDSVPNNLQVQPTRFIGRAKEVQAVQEALRSEEARLLTLVGAAGTGKTRLALQAAAGIAGRYKQGVFFVDLSALREPVQMAGAIGAALGFQESAGEGRPLMDALRDFLARRQLLLILDNFEHLLPAAAEVATLLAGCPRLTILATSREALRVRAERVIPISPMRLPEADQEEEAIASSDAVQLFVDRAEAVQPDFVLNRENVKTVAAICARLDGIPLAIELAAAHIRTRAPRDLLAALCSRMGLLQEGPRDLPERQQTLRGEIDWSHRLLAREERLLFRRASVFPGGCTQEASSSVCKASGEELNVPAALVSLANKSLFRTAHDGEGRFRMLETIREYARERLEESGEADTVETRFSSFLLDLAESAEPGMFTRQQSSWFDTIETEYDNLRAALAWMRDRGERREGLRLAGALGWFWFRHARFSEGQYWLELFRGMAAADDPPGPRAKAAYWLGWMKLCVGNVFWGNPEGKRYFAESLELFRRAGDTRGAALSLVWLGWKEGGIEDADGRAMADESVALARETDDPWAISWCLKVANSHLRRPDKDLDSRVAALEEAITLARKSGDPFLLSQALGGMGNVYAWIGELARSLPWYLDSLRISREINDKWSILDTMNCLGDSHLGLGHLSEAREIFSQGLRMAEDLGAKGYLVFFMQGLCGVAKSEGRMRRAARLWSAEASILEPGMRYDSGFPTRFGLDEEAARAEWMAGQSMTLEQAVAFALGEE